MHTNKKPLSMPFPQPSIIFLCSTCYPLMCYTHIDLAYEICDPIGFVLCGYPHHLEQYWDIWQMLRKVLCKVARSQTLGIHH